MLLTATVAWGQGESPAAVVTEIWMAGEDLAVTRRIPRDRQSAQQSYEEVARSMVNIAESKYQDRDEQTAEWLHQCARELTGGRIGNKPRTVRRDQQPHHFTVPTVAPPEPAADEHFSRLFPNVDPTGLTIEWPISAFNDNSTPDATQHIDYELETLRNGQSTDDRRELVSAYKTKSGQTVTSAASSEQPLSLPDMAVNQREEPMDISGRQVALIPADMNQGFVDHRPNVMSPAPADSPTLLALTCFAAGVVCCFVLHALLLLTPVRLTVCRPTESPSRTPDRSSAQARRAHEAVEPARSESSTRPAHSPSRDIAPPQDKASSIVEDFYSSNLELFAKLAHPTH